MRCDGLVDTMDVGALISLGIGLSRWWLCPRLGTTGGGGGSQLGNRISRGRGWKGRWRG